MTAFARLKTSQVALARQMLCTRQNGLCAICSTPISCSTSVLDHDHGSGVIRDALCRNCNGIEGKVKNLAVRAARGRGAEDWLLRLLAYYQKHKTPQTKYLHPTFRDEDEKRLRRNARARILRAKKKEAK